MVLKMILLQEQVDAVPLEPQWLKQQGYLEAMIECLCQKHKLRLDQTTEAPVFYLEAGSKMNDSSFESVS